MSFSGSVSKWADKTEDKIDRVVRGVALKMAESVINMSPVGNPGIWKGKPPKGYVGGRFRGNWQIGVGAPTDGVLDTVDSSSGATLTKIAAAIERVTAGDKIFITNNLPYGPALEHGHSTQAPHGMVKVTVARFQSIARKMAVTVR